MKYSAEKVNNMSYSDWMETIAKELNAAGFMAEGYSEEHHRFMKNIAPYIVRDVRYFFMGAINDAKAMDYLKFIGLVNNGRCPICGNSIKGTPSMFTSGLNPDLCFHICARCRRDGQSISMNPASHSGCILVLLLMPLQIIKNMLF